MKKNKLLLATLLLIFIILITFASKLLAPNVTSTQESINLPIGYSLTDYTIAEKTAVSCTTHSDCTLPPEYAVRSNCPYVNICVSNSCTIVCPNHK